MQGDVDMAEDPADANRLYEPIHDPSEPMEDVVEIQQPSTSAPKQAGDDPYTGIYTWKIENFSRVVDRLVDGKLYGDKFEVGTYFWRLLIFPKGNKSSYLAVYLDAPEATYTPLHMSPKASFKLILVNQVDLSKSYVKDANHTFTPTETDWGFTQFVSLEDILEPSKGYIVNDALILKVEITVKKDERFSYDSRKETGSVGLKNQGATCYMNSLLQYLFYIPYFRKAVYHMPTSESDEPSKSIPLALQSLFYKLQYSRTSVSTKDLTKSFGWGTYDAFQQHDVQELNRVLCEKLEEKMKGTKVEKVINELFEGHTYNFIKCRNVDYKSTRHESFMDLSLDVKGCKNIYESFDKYCEVAMLEGENKYEAGSHGLQDAQKGVKFDDFPPVLNLQLKRFEYDVMRDTMVKINDRYEFFDELDLDAEGGKYLSPDADREVCNLYKLHSVLVHSGGVHGGHYYAFIRPDGKNWLKFDDERVTKEEPGKAIDEQFGGEDETPATGPGYTIPPIKFTKYSNAYMLVYVRASDWDRIICDVTKEDIAEHLRTRLEAELAGKERRQKEKGEAHLYCHLKIARDQDIAEQVGTTRFFDLVDHDKCPSYRVQKQTKFSDFKDKIERELGVPVEKQRYWIWHKRQNQTFRPHRPFTPQEEQQCLMDLRDPAAGAYMNKHAYMDIKLFLEVPYPDLDAPLQKIQRLEILLFFKFYDPVKETVRYVGHNYAHKTMKLQDLFPHMCRMAGLPDNTELEAYEEIKFEPTVMVERIDKRASLSAQPAWTQAQLEDGDIIAFQRAIPVEEERNLRFPKIKDYLGYIRNRRLVNFRKLEDPKEEGFHIEMLKDLTYDEVCEKLGAHLHVADPTRLRLTQHNTYSHQPQRSPIRYRSIGQLEHMLQHSNHVNEILYYEVLDMPLPELEKLKTLRIDVYNEKIEYVSEHQIRLPKDSVVNDALNELRAQLGEAYQDRLFRLIEVFNCKVYKICDPSEGIEHMNDAYWIFRAMLAPPDEEDLQPGERLIHVYHFRTDKENNHNILNFGDPFFIKIREGEQLTDVKQRIKTRLGVSDDEFAKWRFAFIGARHTAEYLEDSDVLSSRFGRIHVQMSENPYLGLEHEDKGPKRPAKHHALSVERPVVIKG